MNCVKQTIWTNKQKKLYFFKNINQNKIEIHKKNILFVVLLLKFA